MEELYPAQLDGIDLEIETLDDVFEKSIARHEFPNKDGALLEDMGQKARCVNLRCYFWDLAAHQTYADHIKLVNHLASQALFELIHPQYGRMEGMVERVTVRHDDRNMTAEVDLAFVENLRGTLEDVQYEEVEAATEQAFMDGQDEQLDEAAADLAGEGLDLEQALDPALSVLSQLNTMTRSAREMARELDGYLKMADGIASEITQGFDSLVSVINYGVNLPGRVVGVLARVVERTARTYDALATSPARYIKSVKLAFQNLENKFEIFSGSASSEGIKCRALMLKQLKIASAQRLALEAAYAYNADEQQRQQVRRSEQASSFDAAGHYIGTTMEPVLNVRELDETLADVRELLQGAVDQARTVQSLKTMAGTLLDHVSIVKLERNRMMTITLENPMPLHLVCLRYGLPYNMAERLHSINSGIVNPSFTTGEILIYVR